MTQADPRRTPKAEVEQLREENRRLRNALAASEHPEQSFSFAARIVRDQDQDSRRYTDDLAQKARLFDTLFSSVPDSVFAYDREHRYVYANQSLLDIWQYRLEDVIGKTHFDMNYPEELATRLQREIENVFVTGKTFRNESEYTSPAGTTGYYEYIFAPVFGPDGKVELVTGSTRDITARYSMEEQWRESQIALAQREAHLQSILDSSGDCIKVLDLDGHLLSMNANGMCLMEVDDFCTVENKEWTYFWTGEEHDAAKAAVAAAREGGAGHFQGYGPTAKGNLKWWDVQVTSIPDTTGKPAFLLSVSRDLTQLHHTTELLEDRNREIESLNARLRQSMTETHHRVKNNLQLISALIDVQSSQGNESVPISEFVRLSANVRALGVIHDVLTGEVKNDSKQETLSAKAVLDKLLFTLQDTLGLAHSFTFAIEEIRLPTQMVTSLALLTNELFSNAMKHGAGKADIRLEVRDGDAWLEVCDDGAGFPPDFDPATAANTGLSLIETLSRFDLRGQILYENQAEGGGRVIVHFPTQLA